MRFTDLQFFRDDRFAVGLEEQTGRHYLSVPVSNGLVDYEEYYAIPPEWAQQPDDHLSELREFAERCRRREVDDRLLLAPGRLRGEAI